MDLSSLINLIFLLLIKNLPSNMMSVINGGCPTSRCGDSEHDPDIRFPFKVKGSDQPNRCGHTGFDLWCDQGFKRTLIELPNLGNFSVQSIDYIAQEIWVNDLNNCLPKKLLNLNLSNSPFSMQYYHEFSFFNCSSTLVTKNHTINFEVPLIGPIPCLSGSDYFVYAFPLNNNNNNNNYTTIFSHSKCYMVAQKIKVPVHWPPLSNNETGLASISTIKKDLRLSWFMPECQLCELHDQMCAMGTNSSGFEVIICSNVTNQGRPRKLSLTTMIAVILVICSPSLICIMGSLYIWARTHIRHSPTQTSLELGPVTTTRARPTQVSLLGQAHEPGPEFRPTIVLSDVDEMGQKLTSDGENVCAICMVEYQGNDKIGSLPICGHYFHVNCINEWFHSRGTLEWTCPICRARVDS
ncbi:hypothetical protein RND81_12G102100 [Saponaria officinalis]|uniref:RING-type E3 ubiquitin transferase n=1 Tax=Saponaria officinalis TaxID=3572 RepID=A0AAW1H8V3_SAPOF